MSWYGMGKTDLALALRLVYKFVGFLHRVFSSHVSIVIGLVRVQRKKRIISTE